MYRTQCTLAEVLSAAHATASAFKALGLNTALVGGLACYLFGNTRTPEDVDIVVLNTRYGQEELKRMLVSQNPQFYLIPSKDPFATYKVLWFTLSLGRSCKVDLLQPGIMNIPSIDPSYIKTIDQLEVMPFSLVLLLKLQAWSDHGVATKTHLRMKRYTDVADLDRLLPLARAKRLKPRQDIFLPADFIRATETRVRAYVLSCPSSKEGWSSLGF